MASITSHMQSAPAANPLCFLPVIFRQRARKRHMPPFRQPDWQGGCCLRTGEQNGPNIIPRPWVKSLMEQIPNSTTVKPILITRVDHYTTAQHRET